MDSLLFIHTTASATDAPASAHAAAWTCEQAMAVTSGAAERRDRNGAVNATDTHALGARSLR